MDKYLLIESRDPYETREVDKNYALASALAGAGNEVTLFLVQNAVLPTRHAAKRNGLADVLDSGVQVLADEFSLRERGIPLNSLAGGIKAAPIDVVVDQLAEGRKAIWL